MFKRNGRFVRKSVLCAGVSALALSVASTVAIAQSVDIGTVNATVNNPNDLLLAKKKKAAAAAQAAQPAAPKPAPAAQPAVAAQPTTVTNALPLSSDQAIGPAAPPGSAPALAVSQGSLNATEPGSVVSSKVIQDVIKPSSDYNETAKYTPNFNSNNANGALGDSKSSFRGFADGQFDITFDGVPFGDANDPTHHSAAYFPAPFIGSVVVDRGPGDATSIGYAPFGGTLAMHSYDLSNKYGGDVTVSAGNFGTIGGSAKVQSGLVNNTRALLQYSYESTNGQLEDGHVDTQQILGKLEHDFGGVKVTLFGTYGRENYNNTGSPTWYQLQTFGNKYGELGSNPKSQQFVGYNNSEKRTDLDYVDVQGDAGGWHLDNKLYTYAYDYPELQNNGQDQTIEPGDPLNTTAAKMAGTKTIKITNPGSGCGNSAYSCTTTFAFAGVVPGDVTGYLKFNNYRAYGDNFIATHDINAGAASGTLKTGIWAEYVDNQRYQQFYDYTQGKLYSAFPDSVSSTVTLAPGGGATTITSAQQAIDLANASYKVNLESKIKNFQPYVEYEWKPVAGLTITPGYKFESFERIHNAAANNTTVQPLYLDRTYTANLPYLSARYNLNPSLTVYAQASKGFLAPTVAAYYVYDVNSTSIAPQETTNYQVGTVYKTKNITASADVYQVTATNFTVNHFDTDGKTVLSVTNGGTARYQGIEGEGTYAFGNGLAVTASGALASAQFISGPNEGLLLANAPRYTAAGGLVYDKGSYFGSVLYKVTGDQYGSGGQVTTVNPLDPNHTQSVNPDLNHVGAYNTTDIVAGVRGDAMKSLGFSNQAEFKVGVSNVFNNQAISDIGGTPTTLTPGGNDYRGTGNPSGLTYSTQAGRVIYGQLKIGF